VTSEPLSTRSLPALLDAFSSSDPTPGGGSAAALMGAIGASLLAMVAGLPKTKTGAPEEREALDSARAALLQHRAALVSLIDRDAAAYDLVVAAYRRPKATDAEKAARSAAIQDAMRVATETPLDTWRECTAAIEAATPVIAFANPNAVSDVAVGMQALQTGRQGAAINIEINIGSLTDQAHVEGITAELRSRLRGGAEAAAKGVPRDHPMFDLLRRVAERLGHAHPAPGSEKYAQVVAKSAAFALLQLGSAEAREALEALARSGDAVTAAAASEALAGFGKTA
jgi:formiminotetrahydrofolate cyclodeaminase